MSGWALKTNTQADWAYQDDVFTKEECEKIVSIGLSDELIKSQVYLEEQNTGFRKSKQRWIFSDDPGNKWIFERITNVVNFMNDNYFRYQLWGFSEGLQFTEYDFTGEKYDWHVDTTPQLVRKLSVSVQLTDPETYDGGELQFNFGGGDPNTMTRKQGSIILFPSFVLHRVTPVTKGTRHSLVGWLTGEEWK